MEAALKEREKRLEEVKQAKSQKQEVSPTVLAYQKEVGCIVYYLTFRWRSTLGDGDHRLWFVILIASCFVVCDRTEGGFVAIDREASFCFLWILLFVL